MCLGQSTAIAKTISDAHSLKSMEFLTQILSTDCHLSNEIFKVFLLKKIHFKMSSEIATHVT